MGPVGVGGANMLVVAHVQYSPCVGGKAPMCLLIDRALDSPFVFLRI
jgi:hypothetical protein